MNIDTTTLKMKIADNALYRILLSIISQVIGILLFVVVTALVVAGIIYFIGWLISFVPETEYPDPKFEVQTYVVEKSSGLTGFIVEDWYGTDSVDGIEGWQYRIRFPVSERPESDKDDLFVKEWLYEEELEPVSSDERSVSNESSGSD